MISPILIFSIVSIVTQHALAVASQQILVDLKKILSSKSEVIATTNPSYLSDFIQRWTIYSNANPTYSVAAKPATVNDVLKTVQYAARNKVSFLATGGGHGYSTTLSGVKDALNIDLSNFKKVSVDASANTMTIGAATTFADIYDPLYAAGKQIPSGGSSSPSVLGVTLGGGIGPLTGEHGLIIDSLLSVEIVTGSGKVLTASNTQNSDLFWGLRGAGVNFGIITSATYRIYDTLNNGMVYNADLTFNGEQNGTIFQILSTYQGNQDNKLAISVASSLRNNIPEIDLSAIYFGTKEQGEVAIKPFLDQRPKVSRISEVPYNNLVYVANFGADTFASQKGVKADLWGYQLNNLTVPTLINTYNKLMNFLIADSSISSSGFWLLEKFGLGVTASIPDDSTAFPWRNTVSYGFFEFNLPSNTTKKLEETVDKFVKKLRSDLSSGCANPEGNVFANYARGIEKPEQVYGKSKLPRLRLLKAKFDPENLFSHCNPLS